jgi:hypothetical protein
MKKFNNVQQLWSYCLFCPICQDVVRDVYVSMGPTEVASVVSQKKEEQYLHIGAAFKMFKKRYKGKIIINCIRNTFDVAIDSLEDEMLTINRASSSNFYLEVQADCKQCLNTMAVSSDLDIDLMQKTVANISISREGFYFLKGKSKYHVTLDHEANEMTVSKCFEDDSGTIIDDNKPFTFPLINLDFSNPQKVINRIKTLLVFS